MSVLVKSVKNKKRRIVKKKSSLLRKRSRRRSLKRSVSSVKKNKKPITSLSKIKRIFFKKPKMVFHYSYLNRIAESKIPLSSDYKRERFEKFIEVLSRTGFDDKIALFAGSSVGLLRDGKSVPWQDDYDIIMMSNDVKFFREKVAPELRRNFFKVRFSGRSYPGIIKISSSLKGVKKNFNMDIFVSFYNENGVLLNINRKTKIGRRRKFSGLYSQKKLLKNHIYPYVKRKFDGVNVNFFNDVQYEVKKSYGDVYNKSVIHINHSSRIGIIFKERFEKTYSTFDNIVKSSIESMARITKRHKYDTTMIIKRSDKRFKHYITLLKYMKVYNTGHIINENSSVLSLFPEIKYFLPDIKITHLLTDKKIYTAEMFNYVDVVKSNSISLINYFKDKYEFNKGVKFELIKFIMFIDYYSLTDCLHCMDVVKDKVSDLTIVLCGEKNDKFDFVKKHIDESLSYLNKENINVIYENAPLSFVVKDISKYGCDVVISSKNRDNIDRVDNICYLV